MLPPAVFLAAILAGVLLSQIKIGPIIRHVASMVEANLPGHLSSERGRANAKVVPHSKG